MSKIKICLDAGHYGKYNQAPGTPAYYESEAMWKLHLKLKAALEAYGIEVITTRTDAAKDCGLFDRGYAAKGCALFISMHSNAVGSKVDSTVDYVRIYHLTNDTGTDVDETSKAVAAKLAPVIAGVMGTKQKWQMLSSLAASDKNGDGVKNDNALGVLNGARQADVPGIVIEHSFHTNPRIAQWLLVDANLDKLAQTEADTLAAYFGVDKPTPTEPVSPSAGTYTLTMRPMKCGDSGNDVKAMQQLLIANGYKGRMDEKLLGQFGSNTEAAVKAYQKAMGLTQDGIAGEKTMKKLLGGK